MVERDPLGQAEVGRADMAAPVIGTFNVSNLLGWSEHCAPWVCPLADAAHACRHLTAVPGRMEVVAEPAAQAEAPLVVVDYAHTPDALKKPWKPCALWCWLARGVCGACLAAVAIEIPSSGRSWGRWLISTPTRWC